MKYLAINIGTTLLQDTRGDLYQIDSISRYVASFITGAISVAGIILLFMLIGGGIAMIGGAGKNDPKSMEQGKKAATSALVGFVVVFFAYWIVRLIEAITGLELIS